MKRRDNCLKDGCSGVTSGGADAVEVLLLPLVVVAVRAEDVRLALVQQLGGNEGAVLAAPVPGDSPLA